MDFVNVQEFKVTPLSLVDLQGQQSIEIACHTDKAGWITLQVKELPEEKVLYIFPVSLASGISTTRVMLPASEREKKVRWELLGEKGNVLATYNATWSVPRHWTLYMMVSSHTDIGLHNSQYIQRYNSEKFLDKAMQLCDETENRSPQNRYHYIMEGKWFWENYPMDRGTAAAQKVVKNYIQPGKIGVCAGFAGNHTQVFGLEEMCRSAYCRSHLETRWGIQCETLAMVDNNGLSWGMVQPYVDAGYRNILFAPNQWNPIPSSIWPCDTSVMAFTWNPEAGGGGSRIDFRFSSELPQVFYWEGADEKSRLLFWGGGNYPAGMSGFGIYPTFEPSEITLRQMEDHMGRQLHKLEKKYPYDIWFSACYCDDQEPDLNLVNCIEKWNQKWAWPRLETVGNPDIPFEKLRERFDDQIPVLKGDITGGWYQHPVSTPELLAQKFEADRLLPTAEKVCSLIAIIDSEYQYPAEALERAWHALLCNDEHSYGTSGYQGRRVYETWMQHRDWIEKAMETAHQETVKALIKLSEQIEASEESIVVFNPTLQKRNEWVSLPENANYKTYVENIPSLGYKVLPVSHFTPSNNFSVKMMEPPTIENRFYRIRFCKNGGIHSLYDKELKKELISQSAPYPANTFVYTKNEHQTFTVPEEAHFEQVIEKNFLRIVAQIDDENSGAKIIQEVTLLENEKRIEIENRLEHVSDLFNDDRYKRYAYYAFPFAVPKAKRLCHLNGCVAEYGKDITGHTTDVYMAPCEWCSVENEEWGIGWMQLDSQLVEFDHIHPDKTDYGLAGAGSELYSYVANDWLQMHVSSGNSLSFRFRYGITSYKGNYCQAGLPEMAERYANPMLYCHIYPHSGNLPNKECSFAYVDSGTRLLTLKRAEDGRGLIARLYNVEKNNSTNFHLNFKLFGSVSLEASTIDERPCSLKRNIKGFSTLRIGANKWNLHCRDETNTSESDIASKIPIGSSYTGLITNPRASRGEKPGQLYLLWGQVMAKDLVGYRVFRGLTMDFEANEQSLIAEIEKEPYRVARYEDHGLKDETEYYYRVCSVDSSGRQGPLSIVFSGTTLERK